MSSTFFIINVIVVFKAIILEPRYLFSNFCLTLMIMCNVTPKHQYFYHQIISFFLLLLKMKYLLHCCLLPNNILPTHCCRNLLGIFLRLTVLLFFYCFWWTVRIRITSKNYCIFFSRFFYFRCDDCYSIYILRQILSPALFMLSYAIYPPFLLIGWRTQGITRQF